MALLAATLPGAAGKAAGQTADVTGQVQITTRGGEKAGRRLSGVVVWLTPDSAESRASFMPAAPGHFRLVQKDKSFSPHELVIPLGSSVDFPNMDPFFHNVFSLFNGKRFDLGLYEAGSSRTVRFDHEGVSYIFCNIHPEMSAVVIALSTPWVGVSGAEGKVEIAGVPGGTYLMHVWAEGASSEQLDGMTRQVRVEPGSATLGRLVIVEDSRDLTQHKNKFGEDYKPSDSPLYPYP